MSISNSMINSTPLPKEIHYSNAVRKSCEEFVKNHHDIRINITEIDHFLDDLDQAEFEHLTKDRVVKFPLKFFSFSEELNFIAILDLLNFGHGYRKILHAMTGKGASDTIRQLMMGLYIGSHPLNAKGLSDITVHEISMAASIPLYVEKMHETLPISIGDKSEAVPFLEDIQKVMNETGKILQENGYEDLATFVIETCKLSTVASKPTSAGLIEQAIRTFPAMQDMTIMNGKPLYLFKKAQLLVYDLYTRFRKSSPELFDFQDINELTVFADNVIPTLLTTYYKIIEVPETWVKDIESSQPVSQELSFGIRAAAVFACDLICCRTRERSEQGENMWWTRQGQGLMAVEIDKYLWSKAKIGNLRELPRFADISTVYF